MIKKNKQKKKKQEKIKINLGVLIVVTASKIICLPLLERIKFL